MYKYLYGLDIAWRTGVVIYDLTENKFVYIGNIDANDIKLKKHEKQNNILEHGKKLRFIQENFKKLIDTYPPTIVAIERYFGRFNNATIAIAKIHGVINEILADIPQIYYPPKTVKEAIIRGDATKKFVRQIIESHYPDVKFENEDESDAFAVGLCWLIKNKKIEWKKGLKGV